MAAPTFPVNAHRHDPYRKQKHRDHQPSLGRTRCPSVLQPEAQSPKPEPATDVLHPGHRTLLPDGQPPRSEAVRKAT